MSIQNVVAILMTRDECTEKEAIKRINECREAIYRDTYNTGNLIQEHLGLEPDYLWDIM